MTSASAIAAVRPDEWNLPLFLHVLGAFVMTGAVVLTAAYLFSAWRSGSAETLRLAVRSLLIGVLPSYIVLRVSAEWIADKQGWNVVETPPDWIDIGYIASDGGLLLLIVAGILGATSLRRAKRGDGGPITRVGIAAILISILLVANVVALWAMTTKPG